MCNIVIYVSITYSFLNKVIFMIKNVNGIQYELTDISPAELMDLYKKAGVSVLENDAADIIEKLDDAGLVLFIDEKSKRLFMGDKQNPLQFSYTSLDVRVKADGYSSC